MTSPDEVYKIFDYGSEIPVGLQAQAEGAEVILISTIRWLMFTEIRDHLSVAHECQVGCYAMASAEVIMEGMPEDQVRFMAMRMVQMLAQAFLKDTPEILVDLVEGDINGPE